MCCEVVSILTNNLTTTTTIRTGASGLYDRARPSYPLEAYAKILSALPRRRQSRTSPTAAATAATVVELGAGSGIFTRGFLGEILKEQEEENERKVETLIAIEPSKGMRQGWQSKHDQELKDKVEANGLTVEIRDGLFDKIPVTDQQADLVRLFFPSISSPSVKLLPLTPSNSRSSLLK